ncbi:MAG: hypothetical protein JWM58_3198 [Rhizobium sp.]|nr:hypothetical protein [Rhizobium sp.]
MNAAPFPDRDAVAEKFSAFSDSDQSYLKLLMENVVQDENLMEGLLLWLNQMAEARFLNSLKLDKAGEWLGDNAPPRLQIRLSELAKSSQHAAYAAFREGLTRSKGLERAFPKA